MQLLTWGPSLHVGIPAIDDQHEYLVDLLNSLDAGYRAGYSRNILASVLTQLVEYTRFHFAFEEQLMHQYKIPGTAAHEEQHARLTDQVVRFKDDFDIGKVDVSVPLLSFLRDWVADHILETDRGLAAQLIALGAAAAP